MERRLTDKQQKILDFIKKSIKERGYPPSLRDICVSFGIGSPKNARKHLEALEKKGFIRREPDRARAIEVLDNGKGGEAAGHGIATDDERTAPVPVLGRVRAGMPHLAVEDIEGYVRLDSSFFPCRGAFILRAEGESMLGAGIDDGDHLLVRPQRSAENGEIVVAMIDDEATVKRFFLSGGTVTLEPENPAYEAVRVAPESGRTFAVIGKVVSIIKRV